MMKKEIMLGATVSLALTIVGLGTTNAQAAVKRTSRPQVTQFFTIKNTKLYDELSNQAQLCPEENFKWTLPA